MNQQRLDSFRMSANVCHVIAAVDYDTYPFPPAARCGAALPPRRPASSHSHHGAAAVPAAESEAEPRRVGGVRHRVVRTHDDGPPAPGRPRRDGQRRRQHAAVGVEMEDVLLRRRRQRVDDTSADAVDVLVGTCLAVTVSGCEADDTRPGRCADQSLRRVLAVAEPRRVHVRCRPSRGTHMHLY